MPTLEQRVSELEVQMRQLLAKNGMVERTPNWEKILGSFADSIGAILFDATAGFTVGANRQQLRAPDVALVTSDGVARQLAARHGFQVIADREEGGETAAIEMATRVCVERGAEWSLVIPGDAPLLTAVWSDRPLADA